MADKVIYYAVVNDLSTRNRPAGLFRRTYTEAGGLRDEAFTRNLVWKNSSSLVSAERGDLQNDFFEITEDEADQLMEQLRVRWSGTSNALPCRATFTRSRSRPGWRCSVSSPV